MEHREDYDGSTTPDCPCDKCGRVRAEWLLGQCGVRIDGLEGLHAALQREYENLLAWKKRVKARLAMYV